MNVNARELRARRAAVIDEAKELHKQAELEDRNLTDDEQANFDAKMAQAEEIRQRVERMEALGGIEDMIEERKAPAYNKTKRGDSEVRAWAHYLRTGDGGGIKELRASNDTSMNITTEADGGYAVPTGHYNGIIARRDEGMLTGKLGVRTIPGKGTTVNVPIDDEDDGEFVSTAESVESDRDAPALNQVAMTLVKYTKRVQLTTELLNDEDSRLMAFLNDFIGRGMAKTHNSLLLTEVASNGTALKTFNSATAIAVDELEPIVYNDALSNYLDDTSSVSWVMRPSVFGEIALLDDSSTRRYAQNTLGSTNGPTLLGHPVAWSAKAGGTVASAKSVYFGNWNFVGYREGPGFTMMRDPYSRAAYGEVVLHYYFRSVYKVLQSEAIGFGAHPSA